MTTYYIRTPFTHSVTLSGYESTLVCTGQTRSLCSGPGRGIVTECCKHPHLHSHPVLPALCTVDVECLTFEVSCLLLWSCEFIVIDRVGRECLVKMS